MPNTKHVINPDSHHISSVQFSNGRVRLSKGQFFYNLQLVKKSLNLLRWNDVHVGNTSLPNCNIFSGLKPPCAGNRLRTVTNDQTTCTMIRRFLLESLSTRHHEPVLFHLNILETVKILQLWNKLQHFLNPKYI